MIFLLALLVVLWGVIVCVVQDHLRGRRPSRMIMTGVVALWGLGSAPVLWLLFVAAHAQHPGYADLAVPGFLLFGLVGTILYSRLIWTTRHGSFLALGAPLLATVASVYIVGACLNHYRFFRGSQNRFAVLNAEAFPAARREIGCDQVVLLRMSRSAATYRCQTTVMFGGFDSQWPFIPWPDYTEGRSVALKVSLDELRQSAARSK